MGMFSRMRRQTAVFWGAKPPGTIGEFDDHGRRTYYPPIDVRVRWEGVTQEARERFSIDPSSKEVVYLGFKPLDGSLLWQGKLADLPPEKLEYPLSGEGTWEITRTGTYPNMRASKFLYVAQLGIPDQYNKVGGMV